MVSLTNLDRVVVFGAGEVLVDAVERAQDLGFETAAVTAPRQEGTRIRGEHMTDHLRSMGVKTLVCENLNDDSVRTLLSPETLGLSFGAAWIFNEDFINALDGQLVNFHGSRLPQDRGGGGFSWRILRDDPLGYSQAHVVVPTIDAGDVLLSEEYRFPAWCTTPADYAEVANEREADLVDEFLTGVAEGREFELESQSSYLSSYWPRLSTEEHGYIDWDWHLDEVVQFTRAFSDPYEGAKTFVKGTEVRLKDCEAFSADGTFHPFQTGILYRKHDGRGYVATKEGTLIVGQLLDSDDTPYLSEVSVGDRFYTPDERLEQAKRTRVRFTPTEMVREDN
jgi:methionyl-tRNA formyltransferase